MILNLIATLLMIALALWQVRNVIEVWGGPYEGKFTYFLISGSILIGALLTLLAVWL